MTFSAELRAATAAERGQLLSAPIIDDCLAGRVTRESYRGFLTQAYHHVKHTVPLLMACGARLPERLEWLRRGVAEYIDEEYGHEQWILADLTEAGFDAVAGFSFSTNWVCTAPLATSRPASRSISMRSARIRFGPCHMYNN